MDLYSTTAQSASKLLTEKYSTSFSSASRLFPKNIRADIYNIYGLVRIADEIVDTYQGKDTLKLLNDLESETYLAIKRKYSTNVIVHSFALTATKYGISEDLIKPFFASMRVDISKKTFTEKEYQEYIHGSAEVVGLMCLKVFTGGHQDRYNQLKSGAAALGSAYQKVNFLRDVADDYTKLGRFYFPNTTMAYLDEAEKAKIVRDIKADFADALPAIKKLPKSYRPAVMASYRYYSELLTKIELTSIEEIKRHRVRVPNYRKLILLGSTVAKERIR